jgi:hypothetical protein
MSEELMPPAEIKKMAGGASKPEDQVKALEALGIPCRLVRKSVLVSRHHVRAWLAGEHVVTRRPNFGALKK